MGANQDLLRVLGQSRVLDLAAGTTLQHAQKTKDLLPVQLQNNRPAIPLLPQGFPEAGLAVGV